MTQTVPEVSRDEIIRLYNVLVGGIDEDATNDEDRAYGGVIRAAKGKLVESMAKYMVQWAWGDAGGTLDRLSFNNVRRYPVPINPDYINKFPSAIRDYITEHMNDYTYNSQVDVHVFIDEKFVLGIECKAYAENAMLKRILVDFMLLKKLHLDLQCALLQLESMLGGDYSSLPDESFGSTSTHTLMSYFPDIDLQIITLLEGERDINRPVHKAGFFKELQSGHLDRAIAHFSRLLTPFI